MGFTRDQLVERAKKDLAERLDVDADDVTEISVNEREFPDMSLGAPVDGEMSAQMISTGWEMKFGVDDAEYEYRADQYQLRLVNFEGENYLVDEVK
jgi:hypothetical protein